MLVARTIAMALMFIPLAIAISYMDVRYRRIPNKLVLVILSGGLILNTVFGGRNGLMASVAGCAIAFGLMFLLHLFGTMGAGDVKLSAAIGSAIGVAHVLPMLLIIAVTGALFAICKMIYARRFGRTMFGVAQFFYGLLPGQTVPQFEVPADNSITLPYALPICLGGLISLLIFNA